MDQLPNELLQLILERCEHASLKAMRLVNRDISDVATQYVFEEFHLGVWDYGLQKLAGITQSKLAKHVKSLVFHSEILPDLDRDSWEHSIDFRPSFSEWQSQLQTDMDAVELRRMYHHHHTRWPKHELGFVTLEKAWQAFKLRRASQLSWSTDREGLLFKEHFTSLPNLVMATVKCATPFVTPLNKLPPWKGLREEILVGPDNWMFSSAYAQQREDESSGLAALYLLEAIGYRAGFAGMKQVQYLTMDSAHRHSFAQIMDTSRSPSMHRRSSLSSINGRHHELVDAFRSLTTLHVNHPYASDRTGPDAGQAAREIVEFLRAAKKLRKLYLAFGTAEKKGYDEYRSEFALQSLFSSHELLWPDIEELSLEIGLKAEDFVEFLKIHTKSLRKLELRDMVSDDWPSVLSQLSAMPDLQELYLECLWQWYLEPNEDVDGGFYLCLFAEGSDVDNPAVKRAMNYLLRGDGELPKLKSLSHGYGDLYLDE